MLCDTGPYPDQNPRGDVTFYKDEYPYLIV